MNSKRSAGSKQPILAELVHLARGAGEILFSGYEEEHQIDYKGKIDLVTEMDGKSEAFLLERIKARFPQHYILAEESGETAGSREHCWYVDPLDGTVNYAHGIPFFSVSIAYAADGQLCLAVVYDPLREEMFSAEHGRGAWRNGHPLHTSKVNRLERSLLVTGFPYNAWTSPENNLEFFGRFVRRTQGVRRLGSAALDLCYVAAGRFDGYWELSLNPWDVAAGGLIAKEAGAVVTNLQGGADFISPPCSLLASSPGIHHQMMTVLQEP